MHHICMYIYANDIRLQLAPLTHNGIICQRVDHDRDLLRIRGLSVIPNITTARGFHLKS